MKHFKGGGGGSSYKSLGISAIMCVFPCNERLFHTHKQEQYCKSVHLSLHVFRQ
jgi:hypothetical protein